MCEMVLVFTMGFLHRQLSNDIGVAWWEEAGPGAAALVSRLVGRLCWFTACQRRSLFNSGDKFSQMLRPYYGKEVYRALRGDKDLPVE